MFADDTFYTGPPIDDAAVRAAEEQLGVTLPAAYVDLLRQRNGGVPMRTADRCGRCVRLVASSPELAYNSRHLGGLLAGVDWRRVPPVARRIGPGASA